MTYREIKKLALRINGEWLLATDTTGLNDDQLMKMTSADSIRYQQAQREIALELIRRGGGTLS